MLSRREFGKLALASVPAATVLGGSDLLHRVRAGEAQLEDRGRADRHDHLQLPQHARSERRGDAPVHPRLRHQRGRVDGRTDRELRGRADAGGRGGGRRTWSGGGAPGGPGGAGRGRAVNAARCRRNCRPGATQGCVERHRVRDPGAGRRRGGGGGGGGRGRGEARSPSRRPRSRSRPPS